MSCAKVCNGRIICLNSAKIRVKSETDNLIIDPYKTLHQCQPIEKNNAVLAAGNSDTDAVVVTEHIVSLNGFS